MFHLLAARRLLCLTSISVSGVFAQTQTQSPTPASVPAATIPAGKERAGPAPYRSAFEGYQPYSDEPIQSWKESNDTVGKIGGWRVYAREAQGAPAAPAKEPAAGASPAAGAAPRPAAPAPAAADPHAGHGKR